MSERLAHLQTVFGDEHAAAFEQILEDTAKAHFDAYKFKTTATAPIHAKRAELAAKVDKFWFTSLTQCNGTAQLLDPVDIPALETLEKVEIVHGEDPRNWDITFTFSKKNAFFENRSLTKSFTVVPPTGSDAPAPAPYDLEADVYTTASEIKWTSDSHNLVKKAPKVDVDALEENDEFDGSFGSFFNHFATEGEDDIGLSEILLEWYSHATEFAAGLVPIEDSDDESYDEDFDDEESLDGEVDLESEEEEKPAKKKSKK